MKSSSQKLILSLVAMAIIAGAFFMLSPNSQDGKSQGDQSAKNGLITVTKSQYGEADYSKSSPSNQSKQKAPETQPVEKQRPLKPSGKTNSIFTMPKIFVDHSRVVFQDHKKKEYSIADLKGRYVIVNLWATWCAPCVEELPSLQRLRSKVDTKAIEVIAISLDRKKNFSQLAEFWRKHDLKGLPLFFDHKRKATTHLVGKGLPSTIIIGPDGYEVARYDGPLQWDSPKVIAAIKELF